MDFVDNLPLQAPPEVFGMHENADITKNQNDTVTLFKTLVLTEGGGSGGGGGGSTDDKIDSVASDILSKLPDDYGESGRGLLHRGAHGCCIALNEGPLNVSRSCVAPPWVDVAVMAPSLRRGSLCSAPTPPRAPAPFPPLLDMEAAMIKYKVKWEESMNTVLCQELIKFNRLLGTIRRSLNEIKKAVKGLIVMSVELDAVGGSLVFARQPAMWK